MNSPDNILVSIITAVYNRQSYLEQAVLSVMNQTYKNIEYIIIDGGSADGTLDIVRKYDDRIDYWISEPDKGMYFAMNKGIRKASGELIGILNSDDYYYPWAVEEIVKSFSSSGTDILHGNTTFINEYPDFCHFTYARPDIGQMFLQPSIFHSTCFVKRNVYSEIGLFDEDFHLIADYDFLLRALEYNYIFQYVERQISVFRYGGASKSGKGWNESIKLLKKHPDHKCSRWKIYQNILIIPLKIKIKEIIRYDKIIENRLRRS